MWRFTVMGRMAASTLIMAVFCATVVQVNGQCERCGFLRLSCCLEDDYQFPTTTVTSTVTTATTQHQTLTSTEHLTETLTQSTTITEHATVTETSTELATTTITDTQLPSTVTSTSTETVTATTTEQVASVKTVTEVESVTEVETQNVTQTVTETLNLTITTTKVVTTEPNVQTVTETKSVNNTDTLQCITSSSLAAESDCPTSITTLTEVITVSESPFCSGQPQALDTITTAQNNFGNGTIAAITLAVILVLTAVVCILSWVVCFRASQKKGHSLNPVQLMRVGTGADTRSSDDGRPLAVRNPVYATIDTLPSITAEMAESLDSDPPGYYTVEMDGRSGVKYRNAPRSKLEMAEDDDLTNSQMNEYDDIPSANRATVESIYSTDMDLYWAPATTLEELRKQLKVKSLKAYCHIEPQHVSLSSPLGEGEFGTVYKGVWASGNGSIEVAVKTLHHEKGKSTVEGNGQMELLKEAAIMGQFNHANVVGIHGVVDTTDTVMLVMEFMAGGNLKSYLDSAAENPLQVDPLRLLRWCQDIASAMRYLSSKGFIHRDLAARNILRNGKDQCKIADFGLSRDLEQDYYYKPKGGRIPVKWTAPEAILYRKYTTKSDVWSFGMVMYEIWSLGHKPFETWEIDDIVKALSSGFCHTPPPGCPRAVYHLMVQCWNPDYHQRVSFDNLTARLSENPASLLAWTEEDQASAPQANVLGAPLEEGAALYQDLQKLYNGAQIMH